MRFLLPLFIFLICVPPALAQQAPIPSSHPVKNVEQQLKNKKEEKKKLQADLKNIKKNMAEQRKKLIGVAKEIKNNEQDLVHLEQSISRKQAEQKEIQDKLTEDKKSISDLVLALERIARIPPEAVISRPESPLKTAQSTMLLQSILPRIYKRADQLKTDLARLNTLIESLEKDRKEAVTLSKTLKADKKQLSTLLSKRERIYARTEKDIKKQQAALKKISLQAHNLKDLVKKIEEKQRRERELRKRQKRQAQNQKSRPAATPVPKSGQAQLPASGLIKVSYGKTDDIGAVSQGLKIKTRPNALIVAPMGGVVEYAGKFKGYGQIIILKHQKAYHSLIAGLAKIDTVVGRAVAAGEPIGKMSGATADETAQMLYYELRYKGNPVNPAKKISGLR